MQPTTLKTKDQIRFGDTVAQFWTMSKDDINESSDCSDAVDTSNTSTMGPDDVEEGQTVLDGNKEDNAAMAQVESETEDSQSTLPYNYELELVGRGSMVDLTSSRESAASSVLYSSDDLVTQLEDSSALMSPSPKKEMKPSHATETQPMKPLGASSPMPSLTMEPTQSNEILQSTFEEDYSDVKKSAAVCNILMDCFHSLSVSDGASPSTSSSSSSNEKQEQRSPSEQLSGSHCTDNSWSIDETTPDCLPDLPSDSQYAEILELVNETQSEDESAVVFGSTTDEDNSEIQQKLKVMVPEKKAEKKKYRIMKYGSDDEGPDVTDLTKGPKARAAVTQNIDNVALPNIKPPIKSETETAVDEIDKAVKKLTVVIARMKSSEIAEILEESNN